MKTVYKSRKVECGVELTLRELLEHVDGLDFSDLYCFDQSCDSIVAKVKGKEVKLDSIKVILTNPEEEDDN